VRDLGLVRHGLQAVPSEPALVALQPDGAPLVVWRDPAKTAVALRRFSGADAKRWPGFVDLAGRAARVLRAAYLIRPPRPHATDLAGLIDMLRLGVQLRSMGGDEMVEVLRALPMAAVELLDEWFENETLRGALGAMAVRGMMQGPMSAGTAFLLFHHCAGTERDGLDTGAWARGGSDGLVRALVGAARHHGAEIRLGSMVRRVIVRDGRAVGVVVDGGDEIAASRVLSSATPRHTFLELVDPAELEAEFLRQVRNVKYRGAVAKVNLALAEAPRFRGLDGDAALLGGPLLVSPGLEYLERAYDDAKYGRISSQPMLEIAVPSAADPSLAPPGRHVASVLVQYAPYHHAGGRWDGARVEALGDAVVDVLDGYAPNLKASILHRQVLSPADLESGWGLAEGNLYHGEMTLDQVLFMRPVPGWARYRTPIPGLYLCGAGAHPGGGIAGAAGYNAARAVLRS
jgi:phytoene dehydrogenase-like protein